MKKQLCLISLITCFAYFGANSQTRPYIAVSTTEQIPWERYEPSTKRFIMAGEAHRVSCIHSFHLSHLKYLVSKGFRNLVLEFPYSYGFIAQQYITTGDSSLLHFLVGTREGLAYWKGIYEVNKALPEGDKLRIWGIDHELGDNIGNEYRTSLFIKALELLAEGRGALPPSLRQEFLALEMITTSKAATDIKHRMQQVQHEPEVATFFGERLPHFTILINRLDYYKVRRNDEMLEAFKEICSLFQLDSSAKFLGQFGWGHTNKSYKNSMAWLLDNAPSSPVKNSTFVIGVHYLNCISSFPNKDIPVENEGIVNDRAQKKKLAALNQQDPAPIKIFTWPPREKPNGWAKAADVLFVFSGFPSVTPLK